MRKDAEALLFVQGRYSRAVDQTLAPVAKAHDPVEFESLEVESLSSLMVRAYSAMAPALTTARQMESITLMEASLMRGVRSFPGRTFAQVIPELLLGVNAGTEVLQSLLDRNFIRKEGDRLFLTEEGERCFVAVLAHAKHLENGRLHGISAPDLETTRRVLAHIISAATRV